jgi:hypothetical protein
MHMDDGHFVCLAFPSCLVFGQNGCGLLGQLILVLESALMLSLPVYSYRMELLIAKRKKNAIIKTSYTSHNCAPPLLTTHIPLFPSLLSFLLYFTFLPSLPHVHDHDVDAYARPSFPFAPVFRASLTSSRRRAHRISKARLNPPRTG